MAYRDPEKQREWKRADYARNRERYCAEKRSRYAADPQRSLEANRRCRNRNLELYRERDRRQGRKYYAANRAAVLARTSANEKRRYASDWAYAEARRMRCRLRSAFVRAQAGKPCKTLELIGCSAQELCLHIERQFAGGMGWHNRSEWHVDHIHPLCAVDIADPLLARAVCNWRNLRPAWKHDNLRKNGAVSEESRQLFESIVESLSTPPGAWAA
jgi:hypothetical protein